jgi:hypothetical protein
MMLSPACASPHTRLQASGKYRRIPQSGKYLQITGPISANFKIFWNRGQPAFGEKREQSAARSVHPGGMLLW